MVQRISGFAIFAFLIYHVGWTRIWAEFEPAAAKDMYGRMQDLLANPAGAIAYIAGLTFALYHLCNGLWTMGITWGLLTTAKAQKQAQLVALGLFAVLVFFGIHSLLGFGLFGLEPMLSVNPLTAHIGG